MAHSLLVVPVPELGPTAHVRLVEPFADRDAIDTGLLGELRDFFADVLPFEYHLARLTRVAEGSCLFPEPAAPFRHLTHELTRRFPEYPPGAGGFDEMLPHVLVPTPVEALRFELGTARPVAAHAREAALLWSEEPTWRTLETFTFATAAA